MFHSRFFIINYSCFSIIVSTRQKRGSKHWKKDQSMIDRFIISPHTGKYNHKPDWDFFWRLFNLIFSQKHIQNNPNHLPGLLIKFRHKHLLAVLNWINAFLVVVLLSTKRKNTRLVYASMGESERKKGKLINFRSSAVNRLIRERVKPSFEIFP